MEYGTKITRYDELIKQLPKRERLIHNSTATLLFAGQEWVRNRVEVVTTYRFPVPLSHLYVGDYNRRPTQASAYDGGWAINKSGTHGTHYVADHFQTHEQAPEPVKNWDGPFEIKLLDWE